MLKKLDLTLWSGVLIDAADSTDIEQAVALKTLLDAHSPAYSIDDLMKLQDALFLLTLGTETGSADLTVDSFSASADGTNFGVVETWTGKQYTAGGIYRIPISEKIGFGMTHLRLDVTAAQISGSHKFAASSLKLQGNIRVDP